jgi:hypothetical protein
LTPINAVQASMPHFPAPSHWLATLASAALILTLTSACATTSPNPPANPLVVGHWRLDKSASDLVDSKVDAAVSAWAEKMRKRSPYADNGAAAASGYGRGAHHGGNTGDSDVDPNGDYASVGEEFDMLRPVAPDYEGVHRRLVQVLTPPAVLKLETAPDYVRIAPDNMPARDYHTDEELSRIDEYGTARIDAGWNGNEFELKARYYGGANLVELFEVDARTDTLRVTYHLRDPNVGKIEVNSIYHRY